MGHVKECPCIIRLGCRSYASSALLGTPNCSPNWGFQFIHPPASFQGFSELCTFRDNIVTFESPEFYQPILFNSQSRRLKMISIYFVYILGAVLQCVSESPAVLVKMQIPGFPAWWLWSTLKNTSGSVVGSHPFPGFFLLLSGGPLRLELLFLCCTTPATTIFKLLMLFSKKL